MIQDSHIVVTDVVYLDSFLIFLQVYHVKVHQEVYYYLYLMLIISVNIKYSI